jgi:ABC-2 type transport system permease protein
VTLQDSGAPREDWDERDWDHRNGRVARSHPLSGMGAIANVVTKTLVITEVEVRKLLHDPTDLLLRAVQPALWLLIFGQVFTRVRAIPTGNLSYIDFLAPGILAQSVLFVAIFSAISIVWERDLGIVHKFLASPTPRAALVLGKALSAGVRSLVQVVIVYLISFLLGVHLNSNPLALLGVVLIVLLGAACFSLLSLMVACLVRTRERLMGMGQLMTMPLFFASNAIYPIAMMPSWLQVISRLNPLTYQVDALRALMIVGGSSLYGLGLNFIVLFVTATVMTLICARLYPRLVL